MRHRHDEALGLQHVDGFPNRDDAHVEAARQIVDDEPLAGAELASHDGVPQGAVRELLFGTMRRVVLGPERHGAGRVVYRQPVTRAGYMI
jgi:hypothetical protein